MVLCGHDPLTGDDHQDKQISTPPGAILIVDSVFAFRPEYNDYWEYRIWLEVDPEIALRAASPGTPPPRVPGKRPACTVTATVSAR